MATTYDGYKRITLFYLISDLTAFMLTVEGSVICAGQLERQLYDCPALFKFRFLQEVAFAARLQHVCSNLCEHRAMQQ